MYKAASAAVASTGAHLFYCTDRFLGVCFDEHVMTQQLQARQGGGGRREREKGLWPRRARGDGAHTASPGHIYTRPKRGSESDSGRFMLYGAL